MTICIIATLLLFLISTSIIVFKKIVDELPYDYDWLLIILGYIESTVTGFVLLTFLRYEGALPIGFLEWLKRIGIGIIAGAFALACVIGLCLVVIYGIMILSSLLLLFSEFIVRLFGGEVIAKKNEHTMSEKKEGILYIVSFTTNIITFILLTILCFII